MDRRSPKKRGVEMSHTDLIVAIERIWKEFPNGIQPSDISSLDSRKLLDEILRDLRSEFRPYFPAHNEELVLAVALNLIIEFENQRQDYASTYSSYLFSAYVLRRFGCSM